jgi:glycosyltransferase involved in cell wall biosynthesis
MVDSIHVARWIAQFDADEFEFTVFPSTPNRQIHKDIAAMAANQGNINIYPFSGRLSLPLWGMDLLLGNRLRSWFLQRIIRKANPDFVHALEFQHGAYLANQALRAGKLNHRFIATNYGSDIYWFQQYPKRLAQIKSVLERADLYSAECERDVQLALDYGFKGKVLPVIPNAGGILPKYASMPVLPPSERKLLLIKGYDGWVGRATVAVAALPLIKDKLAGLDVVFYSCNGRTIKAINKMSREHGIKITAFPKKKLSHAAMMQLFSKALVYVGVSMSDGISTSLVEALAMGAFPVQTNTACTSEWFAPPAQGLEIETIEVAAIADLISQALDKANAQSEQVWLQNRNEILNRIQSEAISSVARTYYSN